MLAKEQEIMYNKLRSGSLHNLQNGLNETAEEQNEQGGKV